MKVVRITKIDEYSLEVFEIDKFVRWGNDTCIVYKVKIKKENLIYERLFFLPLSEAFGDMNKTPTADLITDSIKEVLRQNLLFSPHHQEFVYANQEFTGVINCT